MELYSPLRLVTEGRKRGLRADGSIDLDTGYDLSKLEVEQQVREKLLCRKPNFLTILPLYTCFLPLQNIRAHPEHLPNKLTLAIEHVDFTMEIYED